MKLIVLSLFCAMIGLGAPAETADRDKIPIFRCGIWSGRGGVAFGPSVSCEINPRSWFGGYGFGGFSSIGGYETQGVTAQERDHSVGIGIVARPFHAKGFWFGGFAQAGYSGSHTRALYVDPEYGPIEYRDSDKSPNVTLGSDVEYHIPHGPFGVLRIGKNFGDGLAATTGRGFSLNGGILFDAIGVARSFVRLFH